jgi:branched-chain amino acid transport system ATP-binding protein
LTVEALKVTRIQKHFGALTAVNGINLSVTQGERRAIIGPNGAGKTTFFNLISGALPLSAGTIQLWGRDVTRLPDWRRVRLGLARTFQRNNLFMSLTTLENVQLAVQRQHKVSYNLLRSSRSFHAINEQAKRVLEQVGLIGREEVEVASLSYGEQRQLEIALALATEPSILLLDEPTAGMSLVETGRMVELVKGLPAKLTVLIVEHDMDVVFALADRITVLHYGEVLAEGTPEEVQHHPRVLEVYLGEGK